MPEELQGLAGIGDDIRGIEEATSIIDAEKARVTLSEVMEACGGFMELLRSNRTYSFTSIQQDFWEAIARADWLEEGKRREMIEKRSEGIRRRDFAADTFKDFLYYYQSILETFADLDKLKPSHMQSVLSVLHDILRSTNREIITQFVNLAREAQGINERSFDNFSIFRERWNQLLQITEDKITSLSADGFCYTELRIPELGVPVRQSSR